MTTRSDVRKSRGTDAPLGVRRSSFAAAVLGLGLLMGVGACAGPLDPIITEQPDDRDPTTDPTDGTSFLGSNPGVQFVNASFPAGAHRLA